MIGFYNFDWELSNERNDGFFDVELSLVLAYLLRSLDLPLKKG